MIYSENRFPLFGIMHYRNIPPSIGMTVPVT